MASIGVLPPNGNAAAAEIPHTEVDMIRAVNEGVTVAARRPSSPAALAIGKLANTILGIDTAPPRTTQRGERRLGLFARR